MCLKHSSYLLRRYAADQANVNADIVQSRM